MYELPSYPELLQEPYFLRELLESIVVQIQDLEASAEVSEAATAVESDQLVVLWQEKIQKGKLEQVLNYLR